MSSQASTKAITRMFLFVTVKGNYGFTKCASLEAYPLSESQTFFKRREVIGLGFCKSFLDVILQLQLRATAEEAPCELTVAPSGFAFFEKTVGTGPEAVKGQLIKAHYVGKLESGKIFDSSYNRGKPLTFRVGVGEACPYNFSKLYAVPVGGNELNDQFVHLGI
ncbi:peptidyl-prolyl cis-trans isomerase FKBP13, chloroplastic [Populus trichocarpa]|uniref:peptidyl-prolyl cis-trans isomerase FKBP13, chloroplastic n=1 Tax=Populus trichocarpa TaxID=3694 RepID=UPI000D189101|nr:peptidyl-prolyl cis-trans isomerase FKBP13, chloroplastic [Populus trichocarpa]|eukprot:XP_024453902.1 peptidyl-prolyl cis-trans isomerase FKBP13, chloroplastic [Populus trichocarpa]